MKRPKLVPVRFDGDGFDFKTGTHDRFYFIGSGKERLSLKVSQRVGRDLELTCYPAPKE
jgi:hypothetical protein